ncbi:MAG: hypothetical protein RLY14_751, partial [Planctomycetota bacterium]
MSRKLLKKMILDNLSEAWGVRRTTLRIVQELTRTKCYRSAGREVSDVCWLQLERLEERIVFSHMGDPAILLGFTSDPALTGIQSQPPGEYTGAAPGGFASYSTLANGLPILNSLASAPTAIYLDFDGDASGSNPYTSVVSPYSEDADGTTFNVTEQRNIFEAWRQASSYFAMFDTNVTTIMPSGTTPKAWLAVGNNISGGYSYVNVFPNTTPESWNQSGDARTRVSGITHELGHNFGLQHQATYDKWGVKTAEYANAKDSLHGPLMGIDYSGIVHKFILGHNSTSSGVTTLQDDVAVIANKIKPYQPAGGDGFRTDDFGNTIATASALPLSGAAQWTSAIIERLNDVDAFSFTTGGGIYAISAAPDTPSGVDLKLEIYQTDGTLLAAQDSANNVQQLTLDLSAGTYYALVSSHQNYGDIGRYFLAVSPLPTNWKSTEVGVGTSGYNVYDAATGIFNPIGSGGGLTGTSDGFQYAYQTLTGDGSITARVTNVDNTSANAVVGITMRDSTAANSRHVSVAKTYSGGPKQFFRSTVGGSTTTASAAAGSLAHTWLKLQRVGNVFTTFTSADGVTWTQLSTATIALNNTLTIGLLTGSANNHALNVGELDNVVVTGNTNTTPPAYNGLPSPTGLTVNLGTGSGLNLAWNAVAGATGYAISRSTDNVNFTQIATPTSTSYTDPNLLGSARYFYRVSSTDATGISTPSAFVSQVNRPSSVTGLSMTMPNLTQLVLNWTETTGETGYRIQRSADGGATYTTVTTVGANVPSYTDSGLTAGLSYTYIVTPTSTLGDGVASSTVAGALRLAAVNPTMGTITPGSITVNWTDIANETGYRIERSTDGTNFVSLATVGANILSYIDTTVASATEYYYRVFGTTSLTQSLVGATKFSASASTSSPTAPWTSSDIGSVAGSGTTDLTSGTFKLISSGTTIGGTTDSFRFTSQPLTGNGQIVAQVTSIENTASTASAGVMIRQSTAANSANAYVYVTPTTIGFSYRATTGGATTTVATVAATAPKWVKLDRTGNTFTAFYSADGVTWNQIGTAVSIALSNSTVAGLAATAGSTTALNTSTLTNVALTAVSGLSISDVTQTEGNNGANNFIFNVNLSVAASTTVTVDYATAPGTATAVTDFTAISGTLTFLPGETSKTLSVVVNGDRISETNESFFVNLSNAVNATTVDGQGLGTIQNDDVAGVTVGNLSGSATTESGGTVTFTVVLNSEPLAEVSIPVQSSNTAEGTVSTTQLTFTAADWNVAQIVTVTGVDDTAYDGNATYSVLIGTITSPDSAYNGLNPADITLTNTDNDVQPTKFFVVNDGSPDRTFEYSELGTSIENYSLNTANTASRGAVANKAGDRVWVLDKNRNVYVYNASGQFQYSWIAGSLATTATVEGIASDGINMWIVDSKSDKIYYYAGAASRTGGTAPLTASFALASGNTNPKDLVYGFDGSAGFLWVVNDAKSDIVYRYAVNSTTGGITLQSSWSLNVANAAPTGITLDPSTNSGDIWVVDNGTTKRVYRYTAARSGTPTASAAVFTLNSANLNPQGIADPPPPSSVDQIFSDGLPSTDLLGSTKKDTRAYLAAIAPYTTREKLNSTASSEDTGISMVRSSGQRVNVAKLPSMPTSSHAQLHWQTSSRAPLMGGSVSDRRGQTNMANELDKFFETLSR